MSSLADQYESFTLSFPILKHSIANTYDLFPLNKSYNIPVLDKSYSTRFGFRMEEFFMEYIQNSSSYELIQHNIQITEEKKTVGEIDFILLDKHSNNYVHVELAYKFYLFDPKRSTNEINCWVGPNKKDSLVEKINKLTTKQFPLLHHSLLKPILPVSASKIKQEVCLLGKLFLPYGDDSIKLKQTNTACLDGYWINYTSFLKISSAWEDFCVPTKLHWHTNPYKNSLWVSYSEIEETIRKSIHTNRSILLWVKNKEEIKKLFVVFW